MYTYYKDGSLPSISTGTGQKNSYTYDALGRLVKVASTALGNSSEAKTVEYLYSVTTGLKKEIRYPNGVVKHNMDYDPSGRVSEIRHTGLDGDILKLVYTRDLRGLITQGEWKIIRTGVRKNRDAPWQLYNLVEDRAEKNDVSAEHPEVVSELAAHALSYQSAICFYPM